jgi:hypothetical protein
MDSQEEIAIRLALSDNNTYRLRQLAERKKLQDRLTPTAFYLGQSDDGRSLVKPLGGAITPLKTIGNVQPSVGQAGRAGGGAFDAGARTNPQQPKRRLVGGDCAATGLIFHRQSKPFGGVSVEYEWYYVAPSGTKTLIHRLTIPATLNIAGETVTAQNVFYEFLFTGEYGFLVKARKGVEHSFTGSGLFFSNQGTTLVISSSDPYDSNEPGIYSAGSGAFRDREWIYDIPSLVLISYRECYYYSSSIAFGSNFAEWRFISGDFSLYSSAYYGGGNRIPFTLIPSSPFVPWRLELPTSPFASLSATPIMSVADKELWYFTQPAPPPFFVDRQYKYNGIDLKKSDGSSFIGNNAFASSLPFGRTNIVESGDDLFIYSFPNGSTFSDNSGRVAIPINCFAFNKSSGQYRLIASEGKKSNQNIVGGWDVEPTEQYLVKFSADYTELDNWANSFSPPFELLGALFVPSKVCKFGSEPIP